MGFHPLKTIGEKPVDVATRWVNYGSPYVLVMILLSQWLRRSSYSLQFNNEVRSLSGLLPTATIGQGCS